MTYTGGNPFGYDPEAVYQDADIEQWEWEQEAREMEAREMEAERRAAERRAIEAAKAVSEALDSSDYEVTHHCAPECDDRVPGHPAKT